MLRVILVFYNLISIFRNPFLHHYIMLHCLFVCFPPWHHSDNKTFYGLNDASEKAEAETFLEAFETFLWRLQKDTITARC